MSQNYTLKDSGVDWLGEVPEHWRVRKIKNGYNLRPSNVDKKTHDNEIPVQLCNYVDVYYNDKITDQISFMEATATAHEIKKFVLENEDVIITKDSEDPMDIGVPALVKHTNPHLLCGYHLTMIKRRPHYSGGYLFWCLNANCVQSQLFCEATGVTRWAISSKHIKNVLIPVPSFEEQQAIADYLDKATERIDESIAIKEKQIKILEDYRKSLIQEIVTKGLDTDVALKDSGVDWLGEVPEHWRVDRIKDVAHLRNQKTSEKSSEYDYLEMEDLSQWTGEILTKRNTENVESAVTLFYKGDVLFGKLRPYLAKYAIVDFDGKCTGEILAIQPQRINGSYLKFYVGSKHFIERCDLFSYGAKMPRISWSKQMGLFQVPLPPLEEQQAIADYLDEATERIDKTRQNLIDQVSALTDYRKSLITECVTGRKRVYFENIDS